MSKMCNSECVSCVYGTLYKQSKARIYIRCETKNKSYIYGQFIDCPFYTKRSEENESDSGLPEPNNSEEN